MLACTALVGCTDEVIENGGNEQQEAKKMEAYISLSINSSTDSSRSTGNGYGDEDGTIEDSGHHADATRTESKVNSLLVVVTPTNASLEVNPIVNKESTINGFVKLYQAGEFKINENNANLVELESTERVDYQIEYKVLAVVNPVSGLLTELGYTSTTNVFTKNHKEAYAAICAYSGAGYEDVAVSTTDGNGTEMSFMMANQAEVKITPDETNQTEATAKVAYIDVERAASKITFRPVVGSDNTVGTDDNVYTIDVTVNNYKAVAERKWYVETYTVTGEDTEGNETTSTAEKYTYAWFNKATVSDGTIWVLLKNAEQYNGGQVNPDDVVGFFKDSGNDYTGYIKIEDDADTSEDESFEGNATADLLTEITVSDKTEYLNSVKFEVEETSTETSDEYSIRLEKYALTNMSNSVYAIRHKGNSNVVPCGLLNTNEYIVDPYTDYKKAAETATYTTWFETATLYSTIIGQANSYTITDWSNLPTSVGYNSEDTDVSDVHGTVKDAGHLLRYCYENSVLVANVDDRVISGVVFAGQILGKNNTAVPVLYKYKGKYYRTLKSLLLDNTNLTISENSSETAIKAEGIEIYTDGKCYYYAGIKHMDNGVNDYSYTNANVKTYNLTKGVGVMEFAIMRNNIYSLAITGIGGIGSSTLELTAGSNVADQSAFITMQCTIKPWIVRFNDIEF